MSYNLLKISHIRIRRYKKMENINNIKKVSNDKDNIYNNIEKYIENNIEKKLNSLLETLPEKLPKEPIITVLHNMTLREIYKNTLQTIIDIINDITETRNKYDYLDINNYIYIIIDILTKEDRKLYVGIVFIFLSFIIYFIDGASV